MRKRCVWKSSKNSTRTSTDRTKRSNQRRRFIFASLKPREPPAVLLLRLGTARFRPALFLAFLGLLLFCRVEVEPLDLPDEPFEHHLLKNRSGPMGILTKFFPVHDLADVLIGKADALRLLHDLKDFPFHKRQNG